MQKDDLEKDLLLEELNLLKNERDYYMEEYRKRTEESAELYTLRLKLQLIEEQANV